MNNSSTFLKTGTAVVDVRTAAEYADGHLAGSINIPLNEIPGRISELKQWPEGLIVCCASGIRSNKATSFLKEHGVDCVDGGSWVNLKHLANLEDQ
jgi:rhodanese-related sulfurtransferase